MKTEHRIHFSPAQNIGYVPDESIDLIVTSPPYPMIEMWDEIMGAQNKAIKIALENHEDTIAFELMHQELDMVWAEIKRVVKPGGMVCINIGDATRTINGTFKLYPNHTRITQQFLKNEFSNLPNILWRKQTNAPNKFMGSGMLPVGAYVTLEHEHILIFRKGERRNFKSEHDKKNRQQSAFFWEERNTWFSDLWDLKGISQKLKGASGRERSGAYPMEIPYRLINMFSVEGDTVLDPFLGTGTTILAAIASGRNSIGIEINEQLGKEFISYINDYPTLPEMMNTIVHERLTRHMNFVALQEKEKGKESMKHTNKFYQFPVMTRQETGLVFNFIKNISVNENNINVAYQEPTQGNYFIPQTLSTISSADASLLQ